jgi:hypothetical protein
MKVNASLVTSMNYTEDCDSSYKITCSKVGTLFFDKESNLRKIQKLIEQEAYPIKFGNTIITDEIKRLELKEDLDMKSPAVIFKTEKKKIDKQSKTSSKKDPKVVIKGLNVKGNTIYTDSMECSGNSVGFDFSK